MGRWWPGHEAAAPSPPSSSSSSSQCIGHPPVPYPPHRLSRCKWRVWGQPLLPTTYTGAHIYWGLPPWNETKIYFHLSIEREGDHPLHKVRRRCSHSGCSYCFLHCDSFQRETVFFFFNQTTNKSVHCSAMHCTAQKVWSKWRCDDLLSLWNMSWLNPVNQTLPAFDLSVLNVNLKLLKWPTRWPHDNSRINVFISGNNVKISHKRVWHFTLLTATRAGSRLGLDKPTYPKIEHWRSGDILTLEVTSVEHLWWLWRWH